MVPNASDCNSGITLHRDPMGRAWVKEVVLVPRGLHADGSGPKVD